MPKLGEIVEKVRSKNAGPFWITVDIFCGASDAFATVRDRLMTARVAALYATPEETLKRFDIPDLAVVKFSFPRPDPDRPRDMHGASYAAPLAEMELD
ncbi:MAG: DUF4387 family protein [Pseudomonadota bacterium]